MSKVELFINELLTWYEINKRDLPWRNTSDAYIIWLSEIILQQTRVAQGLPYFEKFVSRFPTVNLLATASEEEVLRLWQGLGYYSRARNMHFTAKYIHNELNGEFPTKFISIKKLKGVGDYTSAAIASFAYNEKVAVVDGNVYRVLSRVWGIEQDVSSTIGKKYFQEFAQKIIPINAAIYNQAIMEFGALHCTPQKPNCINCNLNDVCEAFITNKQSELPLKTKKTKVKTRFLNYFIFLNQNEIAVRERKNKDIWKGLYDFPCYETENEPDFKTIQSWVMNEFELKNLELLLVSDVITHQLTHQLLKCTFYIIQSPTIILNKDTKFVTFDAFESLPKPIIIANYFENVILKHILKNE